MAQIENDPQETRMFACKIQELAEEPVTTVHGTSTESNDGLTARYSDLIVNFLDNDIKELFKELFECSKKNSMQLHKTLKNQIKMRRFRSDYFGKNI